MNNEERVKRESIPIFDPRPQNRRLKPELDQAIAEVVESGSFILGPAVKRLEVGMAQYCGAEHAVGVASGTDALRLIWAALEIGRGDEVVTTPFSFIATANTISRAGATPVFVDIDPRTFNIDPAAVEEVITSRTKAILAVHLFGHPSEMESLLNLARERVLPVIEDCAQAAGARYHGRPVGSLGEAGCFSFFPTKNLSGFGDGGLISVRSARLAATLESLRDHGLSGEYQSDRVGFSSRLDTLQAAVLEVKLKHLDRWNEERRQVASRYQQKLGKTPLLLPVERPECQHVYHQYTVRAPERDHLRTFLEKEGISCKVYYPVPLHRQALYSDLGYAPGSLPEAEKASREVLSLPIYPGLDQSSQQRICEAIIDFYA